MGRAWRLPWNSIAFLVACHSRTCTSFASSQRIALAHGWRLHGDSRDLGVDLPFCRIRTERAHLTRAWNGTRPKKCGLFWRCRSIRAGAGVQAIRPRPSRPALTATADGPLSVCERTVRLHRSTDGAWPEATGATNRGNPAACYRKTLHSPAIDEAPHSTPSAGPKVPSCR